MVRLYWFSRIFASRNYNPATLRTAANQTSVIILNDIELL